MSCLLIFANNALGLERFSLNGRWRASNSNGSITVPSTVPGGIYTDLNMAGIIGEPYYGDGDVEYEWVGWESWKFHRTFVAPTYITDHRHVKLVAHGIDTACTVTLNGIDALNTSNMFVRYEVEVTSMLRRNNSIVVSCESPLRYALRKHELRVSSNTTPVYPLCAPPEQRGQCHINLIRKMPCSFGWDWGPSFPSTGIWKPIELVAYNQVFIRDVTVTTTQKRTKYQAHKWDIEVGVFFTLSRRAPKHGTISVSLGASFLFSSVVRFANVANSNKSHEDYSGKGDGARQHPRQIEHWWPSGYGNQKLYHLNVSMSVDGEQCDKVIRFGFRTVELVEDDISNDTLGTEFYFKINGVPIFAKGSNWIPADIFPERVTEAYVRDLLQSAKDANMNMIRVWGGGTYETDHFYDLADELGILIWQDLMFSVSEYPSDNNFLRSVAAEVRQQVRRLQRHPCLIVWVGNNENENNLFFNFWGNAKSCLNDYRRLYTYTIKRVIDREDKSRPFLSSTPSNGRNGSPVLHNTSLPARLHLDMDDVWKYGSPNSEERGDLHYYEYWDYAWRPAMYPIARFVSEYGLLSHPSPGTMRKIAPESTLVFPFSPFLQARQHHSGGTSELIQSLYVYFGIAAHDSSFNRTEDGYAMVSYLSQVVQAEAVRTGCESFRRWRSYLDEGGHGHTMGVLYWQLNDIWQAPSWSSIEYGGRWKMLHYFAKKFYSPVLVSPFSNKTHLTVFIVNDELSPLEKVSLKLFLAEVVSVTGPLFADHEPYSYKVNLFTDNVAIFVWLDSQHLSGRFSDNGFLLRESTKAVFFQTDEKVSAEELRDAIDIYTVSDCTAKAWDARSATARIIHAHVMIQRKQRMTQVVGGLTSSDSTQTQNVHVTGRHMGADLSSVVI
ncbi:hypothetical protein MRX96_015385 [Rhipicephalus microplus]